MVLIAIVPSDGVGESSGTPVAADATATLWQVGDDFSTKNLGTVTLFNVSQQEAVPGSVPAAVELTTQGQYRCTSWLGQAKPEAIVPVPRNPPETFVFAFLGEDVADPTLTDGPISAGTLAGYRYSGGAIASLGNLPAYSIGGPTAFGGGPPNTGFKNGDMVILSQTRNGHWFIRGGVGFGGDVPDAEIAPPVQGATTFPGF